MKLLALLLADGFGLDNYLLQRSDAGFQLRNLLGRCLGLLASLLAEDFGLGDCFLQCCLFGEVVYG